MLIRLMKIFDKILNSIYKVFNKIIIFLKKITRIEIIKRLEKFAEKIHSSALIISCGIIAIVGLIVYSKTYFGWMLPLSIFGPILILFTAYLANDFHDACSDLIKSNTTSLGNNAILKFGAVMSLTLSAILFVVGVLAIFEGSLKGTIFSLLVSLLLFINAGTQFNPSLLNIEITKKSTSGEDFISIFSLNLKSMVFFEKIISTILIVLGNVYLLTNLVTQNIEYFLSGVGFLFAGIAFQIIIYVSFTALWFLNSLFLGILSLARKK